MDDDFTDNDPMEALRRLFHDLGLPDNADPQMVFRQMMNQFAPPQGPPDQMIWRTAHQVARRQVASLGPDPSPTSRSARSVSDAVHLVELWLSDFTVLAPVALPPVAWSRAEWIEATLPAWKTMTEPVVATLSAALAAATAAQMGGDAGDGADPLASLLHPLLARAVDAMFGAHVGEGLGRAATAVLTGTDLGLPLLAKPQIAILPTNLTALQQQTELDAEDLLLYCSLREAARQRLFTEVAWISPQIVALVQHYARETKVDPDELSQTLITRLPTQFSPETIASFQANLSDILFRPETSPEQDQILARLNALLALIEGWVEHVTELTAKRWLPNWPVLAESLRRHRAVSRPAESVVTPFIGMNLSLASIRQAANFWEAVRQARGVDGRDDIWRHPDALPSAQDTADPAAFLTQAPPPSKDDFEDELRRLLDEADDS